MELEEIRKRMSVLSAFLDRKIDEKGMSIRELSEVTDLSRRYLYILISEKRDKIPSDDTLNKIGDALEFSDEEREFVLDVAGREREKGEVIFEEEPVEPEPPTEPPAEPEPVEPEPAPEPEEPSEPEPAPGVEPGEPGSSPEPGPSPWKNRSVILVMIVIFVLGLLSGCCGSSLFIPVILEGMGMPDGGPGW